LKRKYIDGYLHGVIDRVELTNAIEKMYINNVQTKSRLEKLNVEAKQILNILGINQKKIPKALIIINRLILIIVYCITTMHMTSIKNIYYTKIGIDIFLIIYYCPFIIILFKKIFSKLILKIFSITENISSKRVFRKSIATFIFFLVIMLLTTIFEEESNRFVVIDELIYCIALIIVTTDKHMRKNSILAAEDFSKLNALKKKIESYSLMEQKDVEEVILWEKYLAYAVSFGIANKISKRVNKLDKINEKYMNIIISSIS